MESYASVPLLSCEDRLSDRGPHLYESSGNGLTGASVSLLLSFTLLKHLTCWTFVVHEKATQCNMGNESLSLHEVPSNVPASMEQIPAVA